MKETIYLDVFFAANLIMNMSILGWKEVVFQKDVKIPKLLCASIVSAFFSVGIVVVQGMMHNSCMGGMIVILLLVIQFLFLFQILCPKKKKKEKIWNFVQIICSSIAYAGVLVLGETEKISLGYICIVKLSWTRLVVKSFLFLLTGFVCRNIVAKQKFRGEKLFLVQLEKNGRTKEGMGLLDTGNCLSTPWKKEPVLIAEHTFLKEFFEKKEYEKQKKLFAFDMYETGKEKIVWIPYHTVGNTAGLLPGVYFDNVRVCQGKNWKDNKHVLVAFCKEKLSVEEEYQIILHSNCV